MFAALAELPGYSLIILPLLIFFARVLDVSIGTIRIIYVSRGMRWLAPVLGFVEVLIWVNAIGQIMGNLNVWYYYVFYAAGFATGNFVGMQFERLLAMGLVSVRIITQRDARSLIQRLTDEQIGVTSVAAEGVKGKVRILFTVLKRKRIEPFLAIVKEENPNAFISVEEVHAVRGGYFGRMAERPVARQYLKRK